jgi:hypothetical protein
MLIDGLRIKTVTQVNFTVEITPTKFGPVLDMNLWCDCLKIEWVGVCLGKDFTEGSLVEIFMSFSIFHFLSVESDSRDVWR